MAVILLAGTAITIMTTSIHTANATYGSLGYETINGLPTGWEWAQLNITMKLHKGHGLRQ
jgi:hypothetical protein